MVIKGVKLTTRARRNVDSRINRRKVRRMEAIYQGKRISIEIKPYSFSEVIMDEQKRLATYKFYDDNYEESEEEKEIFKSMRRRRM
jgi:hypothetical protein